MTRARRAWTTALVLVGAALLLYGVVALAPRVGLHPAKALGYFAVLVAGLAALLAPLGWLEARAERRWAEAEAAARASRPDAVVTPFEGDDGSGLAFDGAAGRALLLRSPSGLSSPVFVHESGARTSVAQGSRDLPPPPDVVERATERGEDGRPTT